MNQAIATEQAQRVQADELASAFEYRGTVYALLGRLYLKELDRETLDELCQALYPVESDNPSVAEGYRLIATALSNLWDESVTELSMDYANCFLGKGVDAFSAAYPYESVYTSQKRLMMQEARAEVLAIYRSTGFEKASDWKEGEDHIAAELEFMRAVNEKALAALKRGDEKRAVKAANVQLRFLEGHLVTWVPMMTADMKKYATTDLYRGLAYLTEGFLKSDLAFLRSLLS